MSKIHSKFKKNLPHIYATIALMVIGVVAIFPAIAGAQIGGDSVLPNPTRFQSVQELLDGAFKLVAYLGAIAAIFFFIYAGFLYVTAGGDESKLKKAHATFINTAIGTAILLGTSLIVSIVAGTINSIKR